MNENRKFLYETSVKREVDETVTENRMEDGKPIEVKKVVKKIKTIKVALLQPDRKLYKGAELFFSKSLATYLKEGLMPYSLVAKRYANDGGPLTEMEIQRLKELREEARSLEKEFFTISPEAVSDVVVDIQKRKTDILIRINAINSEISGIQNAYSDIFNNTAEVKSRNDTIEWWTIFLANIDEDEKGYKPLFGEGDYATKIKKLEEFENKSESFYNEVIKLMSYLVSFWFTASVSLTKSDFETMEKVYLDTATDYKVTEPVVVEEAVAKESEVSKTEVPATPEPTL